MEERELKELFERYLAGQTTTEEVRRLYRYFHIDSTSTILTELVENEIAKVEETDPETLASREPVYREVLSALQQRIDKDQETPIIPFRHKPVYRIAAVAAAAVLLLAVLLIIWQPINRQSTLIAVSAPYGKMKQVMLPDHSQVWLNAGSRISYPTEFTGKQRSVTLIEGQAFFQVVHEEKLPFIVQAKNISVTVLGTSFEIKAFSNEKDIKVTVSSGKVAVAVMGSGQLPVFLLPEEQAVLHKGSDQLIKLNIHSNLSAWRNNQLVFEEEPLSNVFHALERKYNIHIQIETPALLTQGVTMTLKNEPLSDVLNTLSFSHNFKYQKANDSTVVIR